MWFGAGLSSCTLVLPDTERKCQPGTCCPIPSPWGRVSSPGTSQGFPSAPLPGCPGSCYKTLGLGRKEVQRYPGGQGWGGYARPYLQDKPIRAGAVILVHFVDDQEDNTGEEGQGKEDQHGDLWEETEISLGLGRLTGTSHHTHRHVHLCKGPGETFDWSVVLYGSNFSTHPHVPMCFEHPRLQGKLCADSGQPWHWPYNLQETWALDREMGLEQDLNPGRLTQKHCLTGIHPAWQPTACLSTHCLPMGLRPGGAAHL